MEALIFIGFIALIIVIRVVAGNFDGDRIDAYFSERGYTLVEKTWEPFGCILPA